MVTIDGPGGGTTMNGPVGPVIARTIYGVTVPLIDYYYIHMIGLEYRTSKNAGNKKLTSFIGLGTGHDYLLID